MPGFRSKTGEGKQRKLSHTCVVLMLRELMDGPSTAAELAEASGLGYRTSLMFLTALHRKRCVHIAGWENDLAGRQSIRVFAFGQKADAPKKPTKWSAKKRATEQRKQFTLLRMAA